MRFIIISLFYFTIFINTVVLKGESRQADPWTMQDKGVNGIYFILDIKNLKQTINNSPKVSDGIKPIIPLLIPTHSGEKILFNFYKNSMMHPNLAKKYPNINSFVGVGIDNPSFRATIVMNNEIIIGSISTDDNVSHFRSFNLKEDNYILFVFDGTTNEQDLGCNIIDTIGEHFRNPADFPECLGSDDPCNPAGIELVTYRFAAMLTESVTNSEADGTVEGGLTWLVGSVAYVNALYVRDVTFQLQIVENNDELIFTDNNPAPDVFNQDCGGPWETLGCELDVVDSVLDARIGPGGWEAEDEIRVWDYGALFDNGHPGGLAYCPGPTSAQVPDMWVFSHEVMHNFGSPHNYSNEGGIRTSIGGTIMAHRLNETFNMFSTHSTEYALNYQETIGPYGNWWFHNGFSEELTNNIIPELILPDGGFTIPSETPYMLEGSSVPMYDNYTYNWESNDSSNEPYSPDPNSTELPFLLPDQGALSTPVTPSQNGNKRVFPEMEVLLENEYEKYGVDIYTGINQIVEKLPFATREMNMRLVVRTNDPYAGTLNHKNLKFFVDGTAGPFRVTSQSDSTTWQVGAEKTVIWDVSNTNDPNGVNCQLIDILLSINGDEVFDFSIANEVPNTGNYSFTVPPIPPSNSARLMVKASDNIFFDINNGEIKIINNNIPSLYLTEELINISSIPDTIIDIATGIMNDGEEGSVLEFESYIGSENLISVGFDDGFLPINWSTTTNAECDNPGWFISGDASSSYFQIPPGDGNYIATNDDACNSDGSNDMLYTEPIEIPHGDVRLTFSRFFTGGFNQTLQVLVTNNSWVDTTEILSLGYFDGNDSIWINEEISLNEYGGEIIEIAFQSNDNGDWASGAAIDNIKISSAPDWIICNSSGYINYMQTEQIDIIINTNNLELGVYEPFVVVNNIITNEKDTLNIILDIEDAVASIIDKNFPSTFILQQNFPNPFNPATIIRYALPKESFVNITIFDMLGNEVKRLVNKDQSQGFKSIQWNATNNNGHLVSAGLYIYSIEADNFKKTRKMILLK